uniref:Uncharacterized protein n=1 Tax=Arundo donax TaxID=35708 RepID=A0A0A9CS46_ARUDO
MLTASGSRWSWRGITISRPLLICHWRAMRL